jgi:hypothetical protein
MRVSCQASRTISLVCLWKQVACQIGGRLARIPKPCSPSREDRGHKPHGPSLVGIVSRSIRIRRRGHASNQRGLTPPAFRAPLGRRPKMGVRGRSQRCGRPHKTRGQRGFRADPRYAPPEPATSSDNELGWRLQRSFHKHSYPRWRQQSPSRKSRFQQISSTVNHLSASAAPFSLHWREALAERTPWG